MFPYPIMYNWKTKSHNNMHIYEGKENEIIKKNHRMELFHSLNLKVTHK